METIKVAMVVCKIIIGLASKVHLVNLMVATTRMVLLKIWMVTSHLFNIKTEAIIRLNFVNTSSKAIVLTKANVRLHMANKNLKKSKLCLCSKVMGIKTTTNSLITPTNQTSI